MLRLVVWGNLREDRWDHTTFIEQGATFVSRCYVPGYALYKMFGMPVCAPGTSSDLDAELYAVSPSCLNWVDTELATGFDRICVMAYMFSKHAPKEPWHKRVITGQQCAWLHFFSHPLSKTATKIGYIHELPNENYKRLLYQGANGS